MENSKIKDSFNKVKEDIDFLFNEIKAIKRTLKELKENPTPLTQNTTTQKINPTPTHIPTLQHPPEAVKRPYIDSSTGNEGVPTLQPTNQPTNQHPPISHGKDKISRLKEISKILESLDSIKKEVRFKFKKLTSKEMLIFTTIYQLEEQKILPDYSILAEKLNLSEISIRDYVRKIIKKGIPLDKIKEEHNKIILSISPDLKKIASLNTIIQLREL
jgi:DNA-binding MarR family transcriptional regulator